MEDIDHSDQHSVLPNDCQCNESSGAELESSSVTNNTTIKNLHRDESAKGKSNHNPGQPNRR